MNHFAVDMPPQPSALRAHMTPRAHASQSRPPCAPIACTSWFTLRSLERSGARRRRHRSGTCPPRRYTHRSQPQRSLTAILARERSTTPPWPRPPARHCDVQTPGIPVRAHARAAARQLSRPTQGGEIKEVGNDDSTNVPTTDSLSALTLTPLHRLEHSFFFR
uniref:Uncharacterized protein n=1 Tax=Calcidiscus leptoporus TaxID=127549 RepID=A0A7S0JFI4_9EUKA